jgi:cullin 2
MKARKTLSHNEMISEVIALAQNRFTPDVSMIKRCIEQLIDKQFLERDAKNRDMYLYVA